MHVVLTRGGRILDAEHVDIFLGIVQDLAGHAMGEP